jgi:hypothetical protein
MISNNSKEYFKNKDLVFRWEVVPAIDGLDLN